VGRENRDIGQSGEKAAAAFLKRKGYRIVASNLRTPFGELDLVARHNGFVVFVEVKSRSTDSLGPPYISVTREKSRRVVRNAVFYLKERRLLDRPWRIDVVSVKMDPLRRIEKIEIIESAVENDEY
jgi:putative endonuclease